jgi:hypothetical protein
VAPCLGTQRAGPVGVNPDFADLEDYSVENPVADAVRALEDLAAGGCPDQRKDCGPDRTWQVFPRSEQHPQARIQVV